jgi:hypothetical protein
MRLNEPPIFCRIRRDTLYFDLRTVTEEEVAAIAVAVHQLRGPSCA